LTNYINGNFILNPSKKFNKFFSDPRTYHLKKSSIF